MVTSTLQPTHDLTTSRRGIAAKKWPIALSLYVALHGAWFLLYAILGKGFAYAGIAPIYVGEILLLFACVVFVSSGHVLTLLRTPIGGFVALFFLIQGACTFPYLETYGLDSLRDGVIWAYAIFACAVAALVLRLPGFLRCVLNRFQKFSALFLILGPAAWVATLYLADSLPHWPDTSVSIPLVKGGEFCVHLAGIFAFVFLGLSSQTRSWLLLVAAEAMLGMRARGGLLAFVVASLFVCALRPKLDRLFLLVGASLLFIVGLGAFNVQVVVPGTTREFSLNQLSQSIVSIFGSGESGELENTRAWRLAWWDKIWDYTVNGPYFWMGKGYGINLADSDGFQVGTRDEPLRSPHNSHITFLARSGVPGFILWTTLQSAWALSMIRSYFEASRRHAREFALLFAWLFTYWVAFVVCAGFDVFFESPMGGIPFWTIFGLGWGSKILFDAQVSNGAIKRVERVA